MSKAKTNGTEATKPKTKWLTIKMKSGRVTGHIEGFWSSAIHRYVTIPGVSRFRNAQGG